MSNVMHNHVLFLHGSDLPGSSEPPPIADAVIASGFVSVLLADSLRRRMTVAQLAELCDRLRQKGRIVGAHVVPPAESPHGRWITDERRVLLRLRLLTDLVYADGADRYLPWHGASVCVEMINNYLTQLEFPQCPSDEPDALRMASAWWQCAHRLSGGPPCLDPPKVYDAGLSEYVTALFTYTRLLRERVEAFAHKVRVPGADQDMPTTYATAPYARLYGWTGRIMGPTDRAARPMPQKLMTETWANARACRALVVWQTDLAGLEDDAPLIRQAMETRP